MRSSLPLVVLRKWNTGGPSTSSGSENELPHDTSNDQPSRTSGSVMQSASPADPALPELPAGPPPAPFPPFPPLPPAPPLPALPATPPEAPVYSPASPAPAWLPPNPASLE